ncbi:hypothetical protein EYR38_001579 [Pleurotus pulmonarius]|nr:hypothetical protein EYR38_001579 [Pleurotus pulmonarius]
MRIAPSLLFVPAYLTWAAPSQTLPFLSATDNEEGVQFVSELNPYPNKPRITFKSDGTFKITVFSDLHFGENPWDDWGPVQDANSLKLMRTVLPSERPDYVSVLFFSSPQELCSFWNVQRNQWRLDHRRKENSTSLIDEIMGPINEAKVPFSSTQGNHDNQANITHLEEIQRELRVAPMSYTRTAPKGVGGAGGEGNYWVPVYYSIHDKAPALILWFFDSRGGFSPGKNSQPVDDWVDASVARWLEHETRRMDEAWGPEGRQALAFVHIPPHAVQALQATLDPDTNPGLNADTLGGGSTQATVDSDDLGNDEVWWTALTKNVKNLRAIVSGHDHGNEWCAREPTADVIFCFDKHSGYGGYGDHSWDFGVRNFVFKSPDPGAPLDTWIRLESGVTRAKVVLDSNFDV